MKIGLAAGLSADDDARARASVCAAIECADGVKLYVYVSYALKAVIQLMTHDLSIMLHQCSDMPKDKHRRTVRMQAPSRLEEVCTQYVPMCMSSPIRLLLQCVCIRLDASRPTSMRKLARVHPVLQREHHHREHPRQVDRLEKLGAPAVARRNRFSITAPRSNICCPCTCKSPVCLVSCPANRCTRLGHPSQDRQLRDG